MNVPENIIKDAGSSKRILSAVYKEVISYTKSVERRNKEVEKINERKRLHEL